LYSYHKYNMDDHWPNYNIINAYNMITTLFDYS